jgi:hypothetical protein
MHGTRVPVTAGLAMAQLPLLVTPADRRQPCRNGSDGEGGASGSVDLPRKRGETGCSHKVQRSPATYVASTDLIRPVRASGLLQRPTSIAMRLLQAEEISTLPVW